VRVGGTAQMLKVFKSIIHHAFIQAAQVVGAVPKGVFLYKMMKIPAN